jgi:NDP-sugar pyrophosphorylase family protein
MQAAVLAGGLGTRLRPLTDALPKAMVPIRGRPFLWYLLRHLARAGAREAILCVGYRGAVIRDCFGGGRGVGLRLLYSDDGSEDGRRLLGTGGALRRARPLLDRRFLLLNGDTYWPVDLADLMASGARAGSLAVMGVYDNREDTGVPNNVALDGARVVRYEKGGRAPGCTHVEAGATALERRALALLPPEGPSAVEVDLFPRLARERAMLAWAGPVPFHDVGTPERVRRFEAWIEGARPPA